MVPQSRAGRAVGAEACEEQLGGVVVLGTHWSNIGVYNGVILGRMENEMEPIIMVYIGLRMSAWRSSGLGIDPCSGVQQSDIQDWL